MPVFGGALVLGTSAAVAAVAWWLVPPYLALMAFLLLEPAGRRVSATNPAGPRSATSRASASGGATDPAESAGSDGSSTPNDATAPKGRSRGKGRGTRKAKPVVEPVPAAWVQVAPGKFVRVEPASLPAESGPHVSPPAGAPTPSPSPSPAMAEASPALDDAPTEAALDQPHQETAPAEGPAPEGPRDPESAVVGSPIDDVAHAELTATDHGVTPDPEPHPGPGAPSVEAAGLELVREPEPSATDDPDRAAGTQPEVVVEGPVIAEAQGIAADVERPVPDEPLVEAAASGEGFEPDPAGVDAAVAPVERTGDPSRGYPSDAAGTSNPGPAASRFDRGVPPPRRYVRSARASHGPNGLRLRSKRGDGRPHQFVRTFPPRSPPWRGPVRA
jgi:hypothetical protein